jgi:hypothetical protein
MSPNQLNGYDNYGLSSMASSQSVDISAKPQPPPSGGVGGAAGFQAHLAPPVPDAELASTVLLVSPSGVVSVKVSCPAGESDCTGAVTLRTLAAVSADLAGAAKSKVSVILTLATGSFTVTGGNVRTVRLHLSRRARALLGRRRVLRVRATILAHDPAGARHVAQTIVTLRAPRTTYRRR